LFLEGVLNLPSVYFWLDIEEEVLVCSSENWITLVLEDDILEIIFVDLLDSVLVDLLWIGVECLYCSDSESEELRRNSFERFLGVNSLELTPAVGEVICFRLLRMVRTGEGLILELNTNPRPSVLPWDRRNGVKDLNIENIINKKNVSKYLYICYCEERPGQQYLSWRKTWTAISIYLSIDIYILCLSVCFFCLYPINLETAEPIGPKFFGKPHMTPGKVYRRSKIQKLASKKLFKNKFWKFTIFFYKIHELFVFVLQCIQRENVHNWNRGSLVFIKQI